MPTLDIPLSVDSENLAVAPVDLNTPTGVTNAIQYRQKEAIRLAACGVPYIEIARKLDWSFNAVTIFLTSPIAQGRIRALSEGRDISAADIGVTIQQLAPKCLEVLEEIISNREMEHDPRLRAKVAADLLDRAGHGAVKKSLSVEAPLGGSIIDLLKQRAKESQVLNSVNVSTTSAEPIHATA